MPCLLGPNQWKWFLRASPAVPVRGSLEVTLAGVRKGWIMHKLNVVMAIEVPEHPEQLQQEAFSRQNQAGGHS